MKKAIKQLDFGLPVSVKKEGSTYVAYTPALDISTDGQTKAEARKNFAELVATFFDEFSDNADALDVVLRELGWVKSKDAWAPPVVDTKVQNFKVKVGV
jgi:hypothetical protein